MDKRVYTTTHAKKKRKRKREQYEDGDERDGVFGVKGRRKKKEGGGAYRKENERSQTVTIEAVFNLPFFSHGEIRILVMRV